VSQPTVLSPWYVVQRIFREHNMHPEDVCMEYYASMEEGTTTFQHDKKRALLFMSLASAARVAAAEEAEVRALTTKEESEEFGR